MKQTILRTTFLLGALVAGVMSTSPVFAACDNAALGDRCIIPGGKKISQCGGDQDCQNRWKMAMAKCQCDLGCGALGSITCEQAKAFCEKDEVSHHCDDLHK